MSVFAEPEPMEGLSPAELATAIGGFRTPLGEYLSAQLGEAFWATTTGQAIAWAQTAPVDDAPPLTEEEWKASPWHREGIAWDPRMTPGRARALAEVYDANAYRRWLIEQRRADALDVVLGFGAGIAGSIPDPINFVPVFGPAFRAAQAARFGHIAGRALVASGEAALVTAAAEPFMVWSRTQFGDDVRFADAVLDVALGAFAGAALGAGAGAWSRFRGVPLPELDAAPAAAPSPAPRLSPELAARIGEIRQGLEALEPRSRAAFEAARRPIEDPGLPPPSLRTQAAAGMALSQAVDALAGGRPVSVDPRLATELRALREAYDAVRAEPIGPVDDPLVRIRPSDLEEILVERGPASLGEDGEVKIQGRGFGLVKFIFRHGEGGSKAPEERLAREDVVAFPAIVRAFDPAEQRGDPAKSGYRRLWRVDRGGRTVVYATTRFGDAEHTVTMHIEPRPLGPFSPAKSGRPGSPGGIVTPAGDTPGALPNHAGQGRAATNVSPLPSGSKLDFSTGEAPRAVPPAVAATAAEHGVDPVTGEFPELDDLRRLDAAGRLTQAERDALAAADLAFAKTERAREAFDAAAGCLIGGAA